ncbi:unnamed protein product [Lactuca virosa]|uniref:Uncharacterized protein n=1 Tax=Lactuca virosa TaxID=75947 RepID=A0AAU9LXZ8_9ASTR|nr:unnamed protein product [Lactuca virosa]
MLQQKFAIPIEQSTALAATKTSPDQPNPSPRSNNNNGNRGGRGRGNNNTGRGGNQGRGNWGSQQWNYNYNRNNRGGRGSSRTRGPFRGGNSNGRGILPTPTHMGSSLGQSQPKNVEHVVNQSSGDVYLQPNITINQREVQRSTVGQPPCTPNPLSPPTPETPTRPIKNRTHHQYPIVNSNNQVRFSPGDVTESSIATPVAFPSSPPTPDVSSPASPVLSEPATPSRESPDDLNPVLKTVFIISVCNNQLLNWIESELLWTFSFIPGVASVLPPVVAKLHAIKDKYMAATPPDSSRIKAKPWDLSFASVWNSIIWLMLLNFFSTIVTSTAQSYLKKEHEKEMAILKKKLVRQHDTN